MLELLGEQNSVLLENDAKLFFYIFDQVPTYVYIGNLRHSRVLFI